MQKPDLKRIIVLSLLVFPFILSILNIRFPVQFSLLNDYDLIWMLLWGVPSVVFASSLGYFDSGPHLISEPILYIILFLIDSLVLYFISCLIVFCWNGFFSHFGEKNRHYEKIAVRALLVAFIFITIVLPVIGSYFLDIETITSPNIASASTMFGTDIILQELRIQNNFILPVTYQLPEVTVCLYEKDGKTNPTEGIISNSPLNIYYHIPENIRPTIYFRFLGRQIDRNVITIEPMSKTKTYILMPLWRFEQTSNGKQEKTSTRESYIEEHKNGEILLLKNVGMTNEKYCSSFKPTDENIRNSEKIKISK